MRARAALAVIHATQADGVAYVRAVALPSYAGVTSDGGEDLRDASAAIDRVSAMIAAELAARVVVPAVRADLPSPGTLTADAAIASVASALAADLATKPLRGCKPERLSYDPAINFFGLQAITVAEAHYERQMALLAAMGRLRSFLRTNPHGAVAGMRAIREALELSAGVAVEAQRAHVLFAWMRFRTRGAFAGWQITSSDGAPCQVTVDRH